MCFLGAFTLNHLPAASSGVGLMMVCPPELEASGDWWVRKVVETKA